MDIVVDVLKAFINLKAQETKRLELNEELQARVLIAALANKLEELEEYYEDLPYLMKDGGA